MEITFGEQVKSVLKHRNMTIKELAEMIEAETGMKMSRQNLTQRLMRDNFQEQDMRMIASVLGCTLELNLVDTQKPKQTEPEEENAETLRESLPASPAAEPDPEPEPTPEELERARLREIARRVVSESRADAHSFVTGESRRERPSPKTAADIDYYNEDLANLYGAPAETPPAADDEIPVDPDINPYTGEEYESNVVRSHPTLHGFIQVYDRGSHSWSDMTEWAFLGYQERKKRMLGADYKPPIYLD